MFLVRRAHAYRFGIALEVVVTIRHSKTALVDVDDIFFTVFHILINAEPPGSAPADFLQVCDGRDQRTDIFYFFDTFKPRSERREVESVTLFHIQPRAIEISHHLLGTADFQLFLMLQFHDERAQLLLRGVPEDEERAPP